MGVEQIKKLEIFCGLGGVGKTTLATSRAFKLASDGLKVLLITVDPAKRLKEILHLDEKMAGKVEDITHLVPNKKQYTKLDALLLSPLITLNRIATENNTQKEFLNNYIIQILARPNGGMNEILGVIELQYHLSTQKYDTIILDTPPGGHFIDFLESCEKINHFFDQTFVEIFTYLNSPSTSQSWAPQKFLKKIMSTGVKKLLGHLEKVTGSNFVFDFIDAIQAIYKNKRSFLSALELQKEIQKKEFSNWYLITSMEHNKLIETKTLESKAKRFIHSDCFVLINKSLNNHLKDWQVDGKNPLLKRLKKSLCQREDGLRKLISSEYRNIIEFPEAFYASPLEQVIFLTKYWSYTHHH